MVMVKVKMNLKSYHKKKFFSAIWESFCDHTHCTPHEIGNRVASHNTKISKVHIMIFGVSEEKVPGKINSNGAYSLLLISFKGARYSNARVLLLILTKKHNNAS